jgi:hypothetical protein
VPAAIENHQLGIAEMGGEPFGGDERIIHSATPWLTRAGWSGSGG